MFNLIHERKGKDYEKKDCNNCVSSCACSVTGSDFLCCQQSWHGPGHWWRDSDYDIGERVDRVWGKGTVGTAQGVNTVQISRTGITTNSKGQVIVGDTALELIAGDERAVAGLPESTVTTINGINSGSPLNGVVREQTWKDIVPLSVHMRL